MNPRFKPQRTGLQISAPRRQRRHASGQFSAIILTSTILESLMLFVPEAACAAAFVNGGFENGDASGWIIGGGYRGGTFNPALLPSMLLPGGSLYNTSIATSHSYRFLLRTTH